MLRIIKAVEAGRVTPLAVADRLAAMNAEIADRDPFVSQNCIVVWRLNGGSYQFYNGRQRCRADIALPTMANGMDVRDLAKVLTPLSLKQFKDMKAGLPAQSDDAAIQAGLDKINNRKKRKL